MSKAAHRLTPMGIKHAGPGMHHDGGGLYLHIGPTGGRSWLYRYQTGGKPHFMGLGPYPEIGLARAREKLADARRQKAEGIDPLEARGAARARAVATAANAVTFVAAAQRYIEAHRAGWRNDKHAGQWAATLAKYAFPTIGALPVPAIETAHVAAILAPIWASKAETAGRVRGRIEAVLDFAKAHGWRTGENPARWKGHLENTLPARAKVAAVVHHTALPWQGMPVFMVELARHGGIGALALRFTILTAARTGEVIGARWSEIDLDGATWTIPGGRMKGAREHRVPLNAGSMGVLRELATLRTDAAADAFVFPGQRAGKPLSNMAMLATLKRMGRGDLTAHGFRSSFRDWCSETGQPGDLAEAALAHVVADKTEAASRRGDLFDRRRSLMDAWGAFCAGPADTGM